MPLEIPDIDLDGLDQSDAAKAKRAEAWVQAHAATDTRGNWVPGVNQEQGQPYRISGPFGSQQGVASPVGRQPVSPPSSVAVGTPAPDMGSAMGEAFKHLPVDQALKAITAAKQYQGQRGYQRDLQSGIPAAQAFAKWAPMLLPSSAPGQVAAVKGVAPAPIPRVFPQGTAFGNRFYPTKSGDTSEQKNVEAIQSAEQNADKANKSGDTATAQRYLEQAKLLRAAQPSHPQRKITMYGPGGEVVATDSEGDESSGAEPTKGTQTTAQERLRSYENINDVLNQVSKKINWKDVGPQGVAGEVVADELLANAVPGVASGDRISDRTLMRSLKSQFMRVFSDQNLRMTEAERKQISEALPETGLFESVPSAQAKMKTLRGILIDRARTASKIGGQPVPDFAKTLPEIESEFKERSSAIQKALKSGQITAEDAQKRMDELKKKHLDILVENH